VLAALGWIAWGKLGSGSGVDAPTAERLALGQAVYQEHCAACHGKHLEGQPNGRLPAPPHDTSGHTWHHPDAVLFGITKEGIGTYAPPGYASDMPAFGGTLSDDEIRAAQAYIKSQWPPEIQARQQAITEQARKGGR
jgi:mono/diheme cytochrome c family protein